jgi:hypothetical protein
MEKMTNEDAKKLIAKLAKNAQFHAEKLCNGYQYEEFEKKNKPFPSKINVNEEIAFQMLHYGEQEKAFAEAEALGEYFDFEVKTQTDPRGLMIWTEQETQNPSDVYAHGELLK